MSNSMEALALIRRARRNLHDTPAAFRSMQAAFALHAYRRIPYVKRQIALLEKESSALALACMHSGDDAATNESNQCYLDRNLWERKILARVLEGMTFHAHPILRNNRKGATHGH